MPEQYRSCGVCGRTLLRGERASAYVEPGGEEAVVCPLCKPRAEALGWLPEAMAGAVPQPQVGRRRSALGLRERFARVRVPVGGGLHEEPDARPRTALDVFNSSQEVRKVAGLRRSLGEPRVSIRNGERGSRVITVAWDLSWYQWSVEGENVKQIAKGNEISELPITDRDWNAVAAEDGTLSDA